MKREEAVNLLKEIFDKCSTIDGQYIALMEPNAADLLSHGYQLHIKLYLDHLNKLCLQEIIDKHDLALNTAADDKVIIYKPRIDNSEKIKK